MNAIASPSLAPPYCSPFVTREEAMTFVCYELDVRRSELLSRRRARHLVIGRALFVWIVKTFGPSWLSYPLIGEWLGIDHSSVMHLFKVVVPRLRERDPDFLALCDLFEARAAALKGLKP